MNFINSKLQLITYNYYLNFNCIFNVVIYKKTLFYNKSNLFILYINIYLILITSNSNKRKYINIDYKFFLFFAVFINGLSTHSLFESG